MSNPHLNLNIRVREGKFGAYLARPKSGKGPGIVVIQEIFGVNADMRAICDAYAAQGYFALCPDIFWRQEPGVDITDQSQDEWNKAFALYKGFDEAKGVEDLIVALSFLRATQGVSGKVGVTGYCLGGKLTYLMACRSGCDAAVAYYGVGIDAALGEAKHIRKPLVLHIAVKDGFVPPEAQAKIRAGLSGIRLVTIHDYADADHGFCRLGGQHYHKPSCDQAVARTQAFFKQNLR